jgi:hypothetical protein
MNTVRIRMLGVAVALAATVSATTAIADTIYYFDNEPLLQNGWTLSGTIVTDGYQVLSLVRVRRRITS